MFSKLKKGLSSTHLKFYNKFMKISALIVARNEEKIIENTHKISLFY